MHRQTGVDTPALPPDLPSPIEGRYHRPGDAWPLYASLDASTAWAEWQAASGGAVDPAVERRRMWRLEVTDLPVLDLRDPEVRAALGVHLAQLVRGRSTSQRLARTARGIGARGMVVPSAAHDGAWNLVVFPSGFEAVRTAGSTVRTPAPPPRPAAGPA